VLLCLAAAGVVFFAVGDDPDGRAAVLKAGSAKPGAGCGPATAATISSVQTLVAKKIYADELRGTETKLDGARIRSYAPLLGALERNEPAAVTSAVHALVYKPSWHIVRLRVLRGRHPLADIGGPYIIAPVTGTLRSRARTLGSYVFSVQDDLGYEKLVTRFIGAPVDIYWHGALVMGTLSPAPASPANGAAVDVAGHHYVVSNIAGTGFPAGPLKASLFIPVTSASVSCARVRLAAWGSVARHIAARFHPLQVHYKDLASVLAAVTGGHVIVRQGSKRVIGAGPAHIPTSGSMRYQGQRWSVYSWEPAAGQRVYFLAPPG
jgi:hypothetical protein